MEGVVNIIKTFPHRQEVAKDCLKDSITNIRLGRLSKALKYISLDYRDTFMDKLGGDSVRDNLVKDAALMLSGQYGELSRLISFMATDNDRHSCEDVEYSLLYSRLRRIGLKVLQLKIYNESDRGRCVYMLCSAKRADGVLSDEAADVISRILHEAFVLKEGDRLVEKDKSSYLVFVRKEKYKLNVAAVGAVRKKGESSGDRHMFLNAGGGEFAMLLGDGCGCGNAAGNVSKRVIDLAARFLKCGYRGESIITLINSLMLLSGGEDSYSTLDMCLTNLYTGETTFAKSGASLSFIKHDDWVETITGKGLPVGMIQSFSTDITRKKLYHGDMVIMLSDGVLDGIGNIQKEETLKTVIRKLPKGAPKETAGAILMTALRQHRYVPVDDCLVLVGELKRNN
ncbi:MAG: PP2C family serine/threonine-protein phosphatase [Clostridiales bacterium]|nr:PP2C family serine/threonine-protein phosphatase [Clostridiales bacterium]